MKNLSVKSKILILIIALSVLSLAVFASLTFSTYKKDKLSFVYDSLASETNSKAHALTSVIENNELFLNTIVSGFDVKTRRISSTQENLLRQNPKIQSLHYHIEGQKDQEEVTLYTSTESSIKLDWNQVHALPNGFSAINAKKGLFIIKKPLGNKNSYALLAFQNVDMGGLFKSSGSRNWTVLNLSELDKSASADSFLTEQKAKMNQAFGLFEAEKDGKSYFVSYSKLPYQDLVVTSTIKMSSVLLVQDYFLKQVVLFLTLITSISLLVGVLSARWLTWHLDQLTTAAQSFENENFEHRVEVTGDDEMGLLGMAFNSMGEKVKTLLDELRIYNTQLEEMVRARTEELQNLTNIQNAMLNSLGQGFVIIDKDFKVKPVYSKVAVDMFDTVPDEATPAELMGVNEDEAKNFQELYDLAFNQIMDFDDVSKLSPEMRSNTKEQKIFLNYAPIKNAESGALEYVMMIGTDKTAELESLEKFKKEWEQSQMVMSMASNRFSLMKVLNEAMSMMKTCLNVLEEDKPYAARDVQRLVHTIKGSFSFFHITDMTKLAHELETYLTQYFDTEFLNNDVKFYTLDKIMGIQVAIECFIDHYDPILQYKDGVKSKSISLTRMEEFGQELKKHDRGLYQAFKDKFYCTKLSSYFQMYPSMVKDLGLKLSKEVRFVMEGGDIDLPDGKWDELFGQFVHVIRNTMDHGIETPDERLAVGKKRTGEVSFKFALTESHLLITLSDDGRGLDWQKIAVKDPTVKSEADAIARIINGGISSRDEVSDLSGRGVGVSSVFALVETWGGKATFVNKVKQGIDIVIEIPLEAAMEKAWLKAA